MNPKELTVEQMNVLIKNGKAQTKMTGQQIFDGFIQRGYTIKGQDINVIKQGVAQRNPTAQLQTEQTEQSLGQNLKDDIREGREKIKEINSSDASLGTKIAQNAAQVTGLPIKAAGTVLNEIPGVKQAMGWVGEKIGDGFKLTTDAIASTKLFKEIGDLEAQGYINKETAPEFYNLKDTLEGVAATGQTAGNLAVMYEGVSGGLKVGEKAIDLTKKVASSTKEGLKTLETKIADTTKSLYNKNVSKQDFIDKMITPDAKGKIGLEAIKSGNVAEGQGLFGQRDFSGAIHSFDKIKSAVKQVPGVLEKNTNLQNLNAIKAEIGKVAESLKTQLGANGSSFTPAQFNKFMKGVSATLKESPTLVGDAATTATKIINKFKSLVAQNGYTPAGLLEARKMLDTWMTSQKSNIFNAASESATSIALDAVRTGGNRFLAELVPNIAVKNLLENQSLLYRAMDVIGVKALKEGSSMAGRIVNTVKRNPVISAVAGGAIGGGVAGKIIKGTTGL